MQTTFYWFSPLVMQGAFYQFPRCFASGVRGVVWGMVVRGFARRDLC